MARTTAPQAFDVGDEGNLVASIDGAEALVWAADSRQPLWKCVGEALYRDVAISSAGVWLVDAAGTLEHRRLVDGGLIHRVPLFEGAAHHVVAHRDHVVAADARGLVVACRGTVLARIELPSITDLAISSEGAAAVDDLGSITVLSYDPPRASGRIAVGGPATAVAWHPGGYWVVGVARRLRPVSVDGGTVYPPVGVGLCDVERLCIAVDGTVAIVQTGPRDIAAFSWPQGQPLDGVRVGRDIIGVDAAPRGALWMGLRHGDVQGFHLLSGAIDAMAPHEGRARVPWGVDARIDPARIRGLHARRQAGAGPLAVFVLPEEDDGPPRWVVLAVKGIVGLFVLSFVVGTIWVLSVWLNLI